MAKNLTRWQDTVLLPVISNEKRWSHIGLERVFYKAIVLCIQKCLRENRGKICTTLSGGVDSSFCLAKVRQIVGKDIQIHTFTIGNNVRHPDIKYARIVSKRFLTIHHEIIPSLAERRAAEQEISSRWKDDWGRAVGLAVFLTYRKISSAGFKCVIAHDGIDELLGGYWEHRKNRQIRLKNSAFKEFWQNLAENHLIPLESTAHLFGINVVFPYLQEDVIKYISRIPVDERTSFEVSKIPLREIAKRYLSAEIIARKKIGFPAALED